MAITSRTSRANDGVRYGPFQAQAGEGKPAVIDSQNTEV
jgi:hypothetical protein